MNIARLLRKAKKTTLGNSWVNQYGLSKPDERWPSNTTFAGCVFTGSHYCVVSAKGDVSLSTDGIDWTYSHNLITAGWNTVAVAVVYGNGNIYVVGNGGQMATSSDGLAWVIRSSSTDINCAIWANDRLYVGGNLGYLAHTYDGTAWFADAPFSGYTIKSFAEHGGVLYAAMTDVDYTHYFIHQTSDYTTWTFLTDSDGRIESNALFGDTTGVGIAVMKSNGVYWAYIKRSSENVWDGTEFRSPMGSSIFKASSLTRYNSVWIVTDGNVYGTSVNGVDWNFSFNDLSQDSFGSTGVYCAGPDKLLLVRRNWEAATTPNGSDWTYQDDLGKYHSEWLPFTESKSIAWSGKQFCIVGAQGNVATSPDGITWTFQPGLRATTWNLTGANKIVWTGEYFVVVGQSGNIPAASSVARSTDGITWEYLTGLSSSAWNSGPPLSKQVSSLAASPTTLVIVGGMGKISASFDNGSSFYYLPSGNTYPVLPWAINAGNMLLDIVWSGSIFCAVGFNGRVVTSPDGTTWTERLGLRGTAWGSVSSAYAVVWTGAFFCVGGANGKIATSPDGITWTFQSGLSSTAWGATRSVNALAFRDGLIYAVGDDGYVAVSHDGVTWSVRLDGSVLAAQSLTGIAFGADKVAIAGKLGNVFTSN